MNTGTEVLTELVAVICRVYVDDIVIKGHPPRELLQNLLLWRSAHRRGGCKRLPTSVILQKGRAMVQQGVLRERHPTSTEAH